jgi:hypothetical protein
MIKRVNFTGRRRVPRDRVQIEVFDGNPRKFNATIDLNEIQLLPNAVVFLEAMCAGSNVIERITCGKVEELLPVQNRPLNEIDGENVFFTLKIVDCTTKPFGRIIGIAENIRPERAGKQTASGRRGILPIEPRDLGEELWQLEFKEKHVFLLVNKLVPGLVDRARSDPLFYSIVYPDVVRRILFKAFQEGVEIDDEEELWSVMWLRFGKGLHPARENPPTGPDREDEWEDWIEDVADAFCLKHEMKSKYLAAVGGTDGGDV